MTFFCASILNYKLGGLSPDWLTGVVYRTVYHRYDKALVFYCSNYVGKQFIIAIWGL